MEAIPHLEARRLTWINCSGVGDGGIKICLAISPTKPIKTGPRIADDLDQRGTQHVVESIEFRAPVFRYQSRIVRAT